MRVLKPGDTLWATMADWGREICGHLAVTERREWLCTNGVESPPLNFEHPELSQ